MWVLWWVWMAIALVLGILEILVPAFLFLGFAIGAGVVGLIFLIGGPLAIWLAGSLPITLVVFAVCSLVAWLALRQIFGVRKGQVKYWDKDINED
ncbi:NfeD family protein [Aliiroseovarius sp. YM-037]|uniref:NfeD family protein n=1 Tax=Aliiroseovarius sp. YM-037 TaxID=3341728 RepID=UPI003A8116CC